MELVKYLKQEHLEALLSRGSVRIGSSAFYKSTTSGGMVDDKNEGKITFGGEAIGLTSETVKDMSLISKLIDIEPGSTANINFSGKNTYSESDFYLFSTSTEYSAETHLKWHEKEGYNAAYIIQDTGAFFELITMALAEAVGVTGYDFGFIEYYSDEEGLHIDDKRTALRPAFL